MLSHPGLNPWVPPALTPPGSRFSFRASIELEAGCVITGGLVPGGYSWTRSGIAPGCLPGLREEGGSFKLLLQMMKNSSLRLQKGLGLSPFSLYIAYYLCLEHSPTACFYLANSYSSFMSQFKCHFLGNTFGTPIILTQCILSFP